MFHQVDFQRQFSEYKLELKTEFSSITAFHAVASQNTSTFYGSSTDFDDFHRLFDEDIIVDMDSISDEVNRNLPYFNGNMKITTLETTLRYLWIV